MRQIFTAIGEDRVYSMKLALEKYFSDDMEEKNHSVTQKMNIGRDGCSVLDLHWVPDSLKSTGSPENLMGFGAPHMHMFITGAKKVGPEDIPVWGFSLFVVGITGACWLVSWPASYATDLSMNVEQLFDIVAHQKKEVHQLLQERCLPLPRGEGHCGLDPLRALLHAHPAPGPGARPHCGTDNSLHECQAHAGG